MIIGGYGPGACAPGFMLSPASQARLLFNDLIQGWRAETALTPGYYLSRLRREEYPVAVRQVGTLPAHSKLLWRTLRGL